MEDLELLESLERLEKACDVIYRSGSEDQVKQIQLESLAIMSGIVDIDLSNEGYVKKLITRAKEKISGIKATDTPEEVKLIKEARALIKDHDFQVRPGPLKEFEVTLSSFHDQDVDNVNKLIAHIRKVDGLLEVDTKETSSHMELKITPLEGESILKEVVKARSSLKSKQADDKVKTYVDVYLENVEKVIQTAYVNALRKLARK